MYRYSEFNDPRNYSTLADDLENLPVSEHAIYAIEQDEVIEHTPGTYVSRTREDIYDMLDVIDEAMIAEVARSKYLTSLQIYEYLCLRGYDVHRKKINSRIKKLMRYRLIQENTLCKPLTTHGIHYYEMDINGVQLANRLGVAFHKGNWYYPYSKKVEMDIPMDTARDVKRVLTANQIVLGYLMSGARMERFGIRETFRGDDVWCCGEDLTGSMIMRTSASVWIDNESILAIDVVRDTEEDCRKIADKVRRWHNILHSEDYLENNYYGDKEYPQLVICGESLEHNLRIAAYLKEQGLWNEEDTILFTEDLLNQRNSLQSLYEITEDGDRVWYSLPRREDAVQWTA